MAILVLLHYIFIVAAVAVVVYFSVDVGVQCTELLLDYKAEWAQLLQKSNDNSKKRTRTKKKKLDGYAHRYFRIRILSNHAPHMYILDNEF